MEWKWNFSTFPFFIQWSNQVAGYFGHFYCLINDLFGLDRQCIHLTLKQYDEESHSDNTHLDQVVSNHCDSLSVASKSETFGCNCIKNHDTFDDKWEINWFIPKSTMRLHGFYVTFPYPNGHPKRLTTWKNSNKTRFYCFSFTFKQKTSLDFMTKQRIWFLSHQNCKMGYRFRITSAQNHKLINNFRFFFHFIGFYNWIETKIAHFWQAIKSNHFNSMGEKCLHFENWYKINRSIEKKRIETLFDGKESSFFRSMSGNLWQ